MTLRKNDMIWENTVLRMLMTCLIILWPVFCCFFLRFLFRRSKFQNLTESSHLRTGTRFLDSPSYTLKWRPFSRLLGSKLRRRTRAQAEGLGHVRAGAALRLAAAWGHGESGKNLWETHPWNRHGFFSITLAFSFWVAILEIWGKVGDFTLDWNSKKEEYGHFSRNHVGIEATKLAWHTSNHQPWGCITI